MKRETKLWLRKKALMALRAIMWHVDEWIQRQEVALRQQMFLSAEKRAEHEAQTESRNRNTATRAARYPDDAGGAAQLDQRAAGSAGDASGDVRQQLSPHRHHETFSEWEARKSGIRPITKRKFHMRRRPRAADFDREITERRKEYIQ